MLDNDFRNPDLERFVDRFFEHEPEVGGIGDVDDADDVDAHVAAGREIQASYPEAELIVVLDATRRPQRPIIWIQRLYLRMPEIHQDGPQLAVRVAIWNDQIGIFRRLIEVAQRHRATTDWVDRERFR